MGKIKNATFLERMLQKNIKDTAQLKRFKEYYLLQKPNPRNHMLIVIGLNSALRISDILGLTYGDIYRYEKGAWKTHLTVREQKTGKTNQIYINREIRDILEMYLNPKEKEASSWLFSSQIQAEQHLSRFQAFRIIKKDAAFAGVDTKLPLPAEDFRVSCLETGDAPCAAHGNL